MFRNAKTRTALRNRPRGNLRILWLAIIILFAVLLIRLIDMQIINRANFAEKAQNNRIIQTNIPAVRGLIYDRSGNPLVDNTVSFSASIVPSLLPVDEQKRYLLYLQLEKILDLPAIEIAKQIEEFERKISQSGTLIIARNLSHQQALMLEQSTPDLIGVALEMDAQRTYLGGSALSHILGYMGAQTEIEWEERKTKGYGFNELVGKTGLEAFYENILHGTPGKAITEINAYGSKIQILDEINPSPGHNIHLSIDLKLQTYVAELLEQGRGEANIAAAVVMDANTGEILALVSLPNYDNNIFSSVNRDKEYTKLINDPNLPLLNWSLNPAAPGSTFKLVTAAAALEEGRATAETSYNVDSLAHEFLGFDGRTYQFFDWRIHGLINLHEAIAWSSNIYFYMLSCGFPREELPGLGDDVEQSAVTLSYYARRFGLGSETGIDLVSSESPGLIPTPEWKRRSRAGPNFSATEREWYYADTCFMGIGQGDVTATPLQIAIMTAAIANNGKLLTPRIATKITDTEGNLIEQKPTVSTKIPVSQKNLEVIREGMRQAVANGSATLAKVEGIQTAGKTGTAEFIAADGTTKEHAWFTGFAPFDSPEIVVTVYFDLGQGNLKASPIAAEIMRYYLSKMRDK
ncbi:MAG: penicillin-binding protein 2 [Tepidiformaceae bacterium]